MSSLRRWKQVGQGEFVKWEEPGQVLEGEWQGQHDGKFGPLGTLVQPDASRVSFPLHTALLSKMDRIKEGAEVRIVYTGKHTSKGGREFKGFDVFVADDDAVKPAEPKDEEVAF